MGDEGRKRRRTSAWSIGVRSRGIERKCERFEAVYREKTSNHRLGEMFPEIWNPIEVKLDKVRGVQKQLY